MIIKTIFIFALIFVSSSDVIVTEFSPSRELDCLPGCVYSRNSVENMCENLTIVSCKLGTIFGYFKNCTRFNQNTTCLLIETTVQYPSNFVNTPRIFLKEYIDFRNYHDDPIFYRYIHILD